MHLRLAFAFALLLLSGCAGLTGLPEGSADFGDTVSVRYTVELANGTALRTDRGATFVLGQGASGLGLGFERALRGHAAGENVSFSVSADPSLAFGRTVDVPRDLPPLQQTDQANRTDYERSQGPATVGQTFPYSFYTVRVTAVNATSVDLAIDVDEPQQRDPIPDIGATLVSTGDGKSIARRLDPNVGATFTINPPTQQRPQTPLGLAPGSYRTVGATDDRLQYAYSASGAPDLIGKDLRFHVAIVRIVPGEHAVEPACDEDGKDCNYAPRPAPYVNGDPDSVLGSLDADEEASSHAH